MNEDVRLMLDFQQGNVQAFEALMHRHYKPVVNLARRFLSDAEAAEDAAQNVFLQLFNSAGRYQPTANFFTWLYTITRNACYSELRRARHAETRLEESHDPPDAPPQDSLEQAELQEAVRRAIAALPENQRMAVLLRRYQQLSYDQIAEITGNTVSSVKSLLHRARQTLKDLLKDYEK